MGEGCKAVEGVANFILHEWPCMGTDLFSKQLEKVTLLSNDICRVEKNQTHYAEKRLQPFLNHFLWNQQYCVKTKENMYIFNFWHTFTKSSENSFFVSKYLIKGYRGTQYLNWDALVHYSDKNFKGNVFMYAHDVKEQALFKKFKENHKETIEAVLKEIHEKYIECISTWKNKRDCYKILQLIHKKL
jgi:hypothetical protein